jgi:phosphonate transport system permease protein
VRDAQARHFAPGYATTDRATLVARHRNVLVAPWTRRLLRYAVIAAYAGLVFAGLVHIGATPERIVNGLGRLFMLLPVMIPPSPGDFLWTYLQAILQTIAMALVATLVAAILAVPVGLLASRTSNRCGPCRFLLRRLLDLIRSIDTLLYALIFVAAVGLGPFAGILAMAFKDTAVLGKLFSEALEGINRHQVEAVEASGVRGIALARFAYLPQLFPIMLSHILYFLESNTRSATVLGAVGGGGIGFWLVDRIGVNDWQEVSFIILLLLAVVGAIDTLCARLRRRYVGRH